MAGTMRFERKDGPPVTALALTGVGMLLAFTMLAVLFGREEGIGLTALPPGKPVVSLSFRAEDHADGSIAIRDAADGRLITTVQPQQDGFIRGTLRGLAQSRQRAGLGPEQPFSLTRFEDGRLSLSDAATGREVALEAFGQTNAAAFARLLPGEQRAGEPRMP